MVKTHNTVAGVLFGMGAGMMWGLVFLAPEVIRDFSPLHLTAGRYLAYGLLALLLIVPRWRVIRHHLTRREWAALFRLAFLGNTLYYILLASAVQLAGIALTSLVIGFLPVAVTIIGSREHNAVPLRALIPSLLLCAAGAVCIGWYALRDFSAAPDTVIGLLCAIGALASWTTFAVNNSRWLARVDPLSAQDWNLLTGLVTGAQALGLIPLVLLFAPTASHDLQAWGKLTAVSLTVALLASIVGNKFWNQMSRLLPLTLVGQMILFETVFALLYGFLWEQRWPTALEGTAFALVVLSVLSCLSGHQRHHRRQEMQGVPGLNT
ncbi:DMT family transporter [Insolitispirillum peregrinum]|uniref:DMT family transporter n=1 Tax=Insolitispirillum peregrinum TaxID=80876 RepID=UPI00361D15C4